MIENAWATRRTYWLSRVFSARAAGRRRPAGTRMLALESLELRTMLAAHASLSAPGAVVTCHDEAVTSHVGPRVQIHTGEVHALLSPDTTAGLADQWAARGAADHDDDVAAPVAAYEAVSRWGSTATDGGELGWGDATTLTWSIVPDGTAIPGFLGEPFGGSNLIAFLKGIYGSAVGSVSRQPWFSVVSSVFERWSEVSGINFVYEPHDDGAALSNYAHRAPGVSGVRGDIRIGGHAIDGPWGTLAYNFFPDNGEMVLDTSDSFFRNTDANSLRLRNVLAHELGHGLGLSHVEPIDGTKLMEPLASTAFDGPQHDDILAAHRLYGDPFESGAGNDRPSKATSLGKMDGRRVRVGDQAREQYVSIDGATDVDYYRFTASAGTELSLELIPLGITYSAGATAATSSLLSSRAANNLGVAVYDAQQRLVARASSRGAGQTETLSDVVLADGTYYIAVHGDQDAAQFYQLDVSLSDAPPADLVNFGNHALKSYGGRQDHAGTAAIDQHGNRLRLTGNRWVMIDFPYRVTGDTVLAFDFASTAEGEVHGIGFDSNTSISSGLTFRLFGTQSWGRGTYASYDPNQGVYHFEIPVGQFYTGSAAHMIFVNDHDVTAPSAVSMFSNIRVYEKSAALSASSATALRRGSAAVDDSPTSDPIHNPPATPRSGVLAQIQDDHGGPTARQVSSRDVTFPGDPPEDVKAVLWQSLLGAERPANVVDDAVAARWRHTTGRHDPERRDQLHTAVRDQLFAGLDTWHSAAVPTSSVR